MTRCGRAASIRAPTGTPTASAPPSKPAPAPTTAPLCSLAPHPYPSLDSKVWPATVGLHRRRFLRAAVARAVADDCEDDGDDGEDDDDDDDESFSDIAAVG